MVKPHNHPIKKKSSKIGIYYGSPRPKKRWINDISKYCRLNWQKETQNRMGWKCVKEAFMLQWIDNG